MVKQLPATDAFGTHTPIQVHPAPDADYWAEGQSNCHLLTVGSSEPVVWQANEQATLILVETTSDIRLLVNGAATVAGNGFPVRAGPPLSFGIPAGASIAIQSDAGEASVTILEA